MWLTPFSLDAAPENAVELREAFKGGLSGLGTFKTDLRQIRKIKLYILK